MEKISAQLTGSHFKGNYIWAIGMQLAWNELFDTLLEGDTHLVQSSPEGEALYERFSKQVFRKSLLSPQSYFAEAVMGPEGLKQLKRHFAQKFPNAPGALFQGLQVNPGELLSFAYLLKGFNHLGEFVETEMDFMGTPVKAFTFKDDERIGVEVLDYQSDEQLIIRLLSANKEEEIYLWKGYDDQGLDVVMDLLEELKELPPDLDLPRLNRVDELLIPNIQLDHQRTYNELIGASLNSESHGALIIGKMKELIRFSMNYQGAKVENEALLLMIRGIPRPRKFIFDGPFGMMMKEKSQALPYLILNVENSLVLEPI